MFNACTTGLATKLRSTTQFHHTLPYTAQQLWDYHSRPGVVARLTPGYSRMKVIKQADNLRDGLTVFDLPAPPLTWKGQHDPAAFEDGHQFRDVCKTPGLGALSGWTHTHIFSDATPGPTTPSPQITNLFESGAGSATITDKITTNLPAFLATRALRPVFSYRQHQLQQDLQRGEELAALAPQPLTVAVSGASGLVGTQVCAMLNQLGHKVIELSRHAQHDSATVRAWNPNSPSPHLLRDVDVLIHLAGHPIAGRFTEDHLDKVEGSRVGPTQKLAQLVAETDSIITFVCASAVGFYGHTRPNEVDELAGVGEGRLAGVVKKWEEATHVATAAGKRVVNVRSGLVIAGGSPLVDLLQLNVRIGGGKLGSGRQHFAWIAIDDAVDIYIRAALDEKLRGPVNAVAPEIVTNAQFTRQLAKVGGGFPLIPVPEVAPKLLWGEDGARELALADQNVVPNVLLDLGHRFRYPTVRSALRHELLRERLLG
ncbi:TIGR01777 family oxidoreductase [Corynebacterium auriscanis]|uniref:TIGR01777 family oxidoreductase n=1 Tax=Corynebacterium auriscanis TaxID=99807 RepID=UPI003CED9FC6